MSSPRIRRLESDFQRVKERFSDWPLIQVQSTEGSPPEKYRIVYNIRGIFITADNKIQERSNHVLDINLGLEYPRRPPQCRLLTPIFHPNFNETEVCAQDIYAASEGLDDLIIRIGRMITFQFYNTKSPLNGLAAKWATENSSRLPVDNREMSPPLVNARSTNESETSPVFPIIEQTTSQNIVIPTIDHPHLIKEGIDLINGKSYEPALKIFNSIISTVEFIKQAYYYRAIIESKKGNNNSAITDLRSAARLGHKKAQEVLDRMNIKID